MKKSLAYKIIEQNLIEGQMIPGQEVLLKVNQTLTQDTTGTMAYLQLETMKTAKRQTDLSVAYVDHNTLQLGFENADDHAYIQSICQKYGIIFSKAGNGICHHLHVERFAKPATVLIGSDSHTPTSGCMGALAIGSGGLDIAIAIAKGYYYMKLPMVMNIELVGKLKGNASAKDIILGVLEKLNVSGGLGYIIEYSGGGVKTLSVSERATIANMGAELGATTSIFPSDENTYTYLKKQNRAEDYVELSADPEAVYHAKMTIDLSEIVPKIACPHSPGSIKTVESLEGLKIDQVAIGSCTNSSYKDLMKVANILKGKRVHPDVSLAILPGSSNILNMLIKNGSLSDMVEAGARILEPACGPCIGMGQAPKTKGISLRTFNRNFKGRCGTSSAEVYLVSPETAAISAIKGYLTDPNQLNPLDVIDVENYLTNESLFVYYKGDPNQLVDKGPNIKDLPKNYLIDGTFEGAVLLKCGDHITTDDIVPSNAKLLPLRSNIPELSRHAFKTVCVDFKERSQLFGGGIVIGGENYGQGSSREHAALVPLHLKVKIVIAKSFARIHKKNLINAGIFPLQFVSEKDYDSLYEEDLLSIDLTDLNDIKAFNKNTEQSFVLQLKCSSREKEMLILGGALAYEEVQS